MNQNKLDKTLSALGDAITSPADLMGQRQPSGLFRLILALSGHLLTGGQEKLLSRDSMALRRLIHPVIMLLGPTFLDYRQVIEDPNQLLGLPGRKKRPKLPKGPVIWCGNHRFKDDILSTVLVARHAYILFGSLPAYFNTFDGVSAYLNGVILCNRKIKTRRQIGQAATIQALNMGKDMIIFPEGVWNKRPDALLLHLWPGAYRAARETGAPIVPVIHYLPDPHLKTKSSRIHTVVADPISMDGLTEDQGLALLRDTMATWYFLLMERYGRTTRQALLGEFSTAQEAWEHQLTIRTGKIPYYDREIELQGDYRPSTIIRPEDVWRPIANIRNVNRGNIGHVHYARQLVRQGIRQDYQRRF